MTHQIKRVFFVISLNCSRQSTLGATRCSFVISSHRWSFMRRDWQLEAGAAGVRNNRNFNAHNPWRLAHRPPHRPQPISGREPCNWSVFTSDVKRQRGCPAVWLVRSDESLQPIREPLESAPQQRSFKVVWRKVRDLIYLVQFALLIFKSGVLYLKHE